jgi:hypothetical protein
MEIRTQFLKEYLRSRKPIAAGPQGGPRVPPLRECMAAHEIIVQHLGDVVSLDEPTRERIRPHQNEMAPELLDDCAAGLRKFPALCQATGTEPDAVLALAGQGTAIGGVAKGWERCYEAVDVCSLLLTEAAELAMDEADEILLGYMDSGVLSPQSWAALANLFADAIRLRQQIQADRDQDASRRDEQVGTTRQRIEFLRGEVERTDQIGRFLAAVERGQVKIEDR